jgi:hypothetical protein
VLRARVKISERSVDALVDAAARIDTLLGVLGLLNWGNCGIGWWSHLTHNLGGGVILVMDPERAQIAAGALEALPVNVARKVKSALHWIREPRAAVMEAHRNDVLRVYSGYWNAFECLVDAVLILQPPPKQSGPDKQARLDAIMGQHGGKVDAEVAIQLSRVVNPGLVERATHALSVCFPGHAGKYVDECFKMKPEQDRLYQIRNAINHGNVDAHSPSELGRIADRQSRLTMIVLGMLGRLIPYGAPIDVDVAG